MKIGVWVGIAAAIVLYLLPLDLTPEGRRMLAIVGFVVPLWVTESIPLAATALLIPVLIVMLNIAPPAEALASFADPILFLFIGSFIIAEAMQIHRLDRRFAEALLRPAFARKSAGRMIFIYSAAAFFISMWISNTATTAMMYPIGLSLLAIFPEEERRELSHLVLLMTSFAASIGGMSTPVGTPPNLIGMGFIKNLTGRSIPFLEWMRFALPTAVAIFAAIFLILRLSIRSKTLQMEMQPLIREEVSPETRAAQRNVAIVFTITVVLWLLPGFAVLAGGDQKWWEAHLPEAIVALIGALLLFFFPVSWKLRKMTITWKEAQNISWGIVLLFGGGMTLGKFLFKTGVAKYLGDGLAAVYPFEGEFMYLLLFTVLAVFISEFTSNTASANLILPVSIAVAQAASLDPYRIAIAATLASSLGFMLPISTAPNAIVFGSGLLSIRKMMRYGIILDLIGAALVAVFIYILA